MSKNILVQKVNTKYFFKWRKAKNKAAIRIFFLIKKLVLKVSFMKHSEVPQ